MLEAKCPDSESNQGHEDFQSSALPTELSGHIKTAFKKAARDRNRTGTGVTPQDFKSCASASSATRARLVGEGFGPSKLSQQIYSLPPLATREPNHDVNLKN